MIFALILAAYTNHAGFAVSGVPVKVEPKYVTLSNAAETVRLPFSAFPEWERRRLAADGGSLQFVPPKIRRAADGMAKSLRRADNRLAKGLMSPEEHAHFRAKAAAAERDYFKGLLRDGLVTQRELDLLRLFERCCLPEKD